MSTLFGGGQTTIVQPAPTVTPPAPLPDSNSPAALEARRAAQDKLLASAGRSSTILTTRTNRGSAQGKTVAGGGAPATPYTSSTLAGT